MGLIASRWIGSVCAVATSPSPPGFIVWGLFASFAALVAGYAAWMFWIERQEDSEGREPGPEAESGS